QWNCNDRNYIKGIKMEDLGKIRSIELLQAIREIPSNQIKCIEKLILLTLLSVINKHNDTWHSYLSLAKYCCLSVDSVKRYIKSLEKKKFIFIKRPSHYTHKTSNHYSLNIDYLMTFHLVDNSKNVDKSLCSQHRDGQVAMLTAPQ